MSHYTVTFRLSLVKQKKLHLLQYIQQSEVIDSIVRSCCALALLPLAKMWDGLRVLVRRAVEEGVWDILSPLFVYIRNTWYSASRLPMFCVFGAIDRTNNACESSNATLRAAVRHKHPNIWCFLNALIDLEDITEDDICVLNCGRAPNRARGRTVLMNDETIRGLQEDVQRETITIDFFLRQASRRIEGVYNIALDLL
ncbi:Glutamine--tRNA ligase [Frankliniella fusca]|uniref:Glutamine--tRNA ligase n=1 Tax=Frankliniella fusca TaxID=407009 RepID=A0AAE1HM95_9NEOP|nr:Glutamine--tRNA ligase [Frankliniella fusca]